MFKLLSLVVSVLGCYVDLTDSSVTLDIAGFTKTGEAHECGTNITLVCSIPGYVVYMRWELNAAKLAECFQNNCTTVNPSSNMIFENYPSLGIFNLTMSPVLVKDYGTTIGCSNLMSSPNMTIYVKVTPRNITSSAQILDELVLNATTDCIYPTDNIKFTWFSVSKDNTKVQIYEESKRTESRCAFASNCIDANRSSHISSVLVLPKILDGQKAEENMFKVNITYEGIQLDSVAVGTYMVRISDCFPCYLCVKIIGSCDAVEVILLLFTYAIIFKCSGKTSITDMQRWAIWIVNVIIPACIIVAHIAVACYIRYGVECVEEILKNLLCWILIIIFLLIEILISVALLLIIHCNSALRKQVFRCRLQWTCNEFCSVHPCEKKEETPILLPKEVNKVPVIARSTSESVMVEWTCADTNPLDLTPLEWTTVCYKINTITTESKALAVIRGQNKPGQYMKQPTPLHKSNRNVVEDYGLPPWINEPNTASIVGNLIIMDMYRMTIKEQFEDVTLFLLWEDNQGYIIAISEEYSVSSTGEISKQTSNLKEDGTEEVKVIALEIRKTNEHIDIYWKEIEYSYDVSPAVYYYFGKLIKARSRRGSQNDHYKNKQIFPSWIHEQGTTRIPITSNKKGLCNVENVLQSQDLIVFVYWSHLTNVLAKSDETACLKE